MKYLEGFSHVHFIGILGSSLSSLAIICSSQVPLVTGSDMSYNYRYEYLTKRGIRVCIGADISVLDDVDLVVYTGAIPLDDEELSFARSKGILCVERSVFLANLSRDYRQVIAVAGTHGKSTVSGMLSEIFMDAGLSPTCHLGAELTSLGVGGVAGGYDYFITEACEYKHSLLTLKPQVAIVLNVDFDHPDCYESIDSVKQTFVAFANSVIDEGFCVFGESCLVDKNSITVGKDIFADEVRNVNGRYVFTPVFNGVRGDEISLKVYGKHNVANALVSYAVAVRLGVDASSVSTTLSKYRGILRRFEYLPTTSGAKVVSDYAHHPCEIKAVLATARQVTTSKIVAVFQPHTYSRTLQLYDEFLGCFDMADEVVIVEEYPARESPTDGLSAYQLYTGLVSRLKKVTYLPMAHICEDIVAHVDKDSFVLLLGAGDMPLKVKL
ncbi:MAG: UDP-N-acetylmuramate--L-alanine ligase [Clostridia bacterium]|nr:UDP-N-acetylmuramate--L-alanine ligase [Clostridia bacterium]